MAEQRAEEPKRSDQWGGYSAWVKDTLAYGKSLVCPMRLFWRSYVSYCAEWGFPQASASDFVTWLSSEEGVEVHTNSRSRGPFKRYVTGLGFKTGRT